MRKLPTPPNAICTYQNQDGEIICCLHNYCNLLCAYACVGGGGSLIGKSFSELFLAKKNHVTVLDVDNEKIKCLQNGNSFFSENQHQEYLDKFIKNITPVSRQIKLFRLELY